MRLRYFAVSLLCLVAGTAGAQQGKSPELRIDYTQETLPNGLTVLYHVDHSTPVAAVLLWYNVGSKMEQPGRTGFAHLFEHMMFMMPMPPTRRLTAAIPDRRNVKICVVSPRVLRKSA